MQDKKTLVWVVATLSSVGGGEQLLLEGANHYRSIGYDVHIFTWSFNEEALFDGTYDNKNIHVLSGKQTSRQSIFRRALSRAYSLISLRKKIQALNPERVICQSEYDVALVYLATLFTKIPYSILIFGQTFQFPHDIAKYSLMFKKQLKEIVGSMPGYGETIPLQRPKTSLINIIANELVCLIRYFAVRKARSRIVFSKQVQWEVSKLYKANSIILKGAYPEGIINYVDTEDRKLSLDIPSTSKVFLSLSRLDKKKRIDLCIKAFDLLNPENSILLIGGKGEEAAKLEALVTELGIGHKVKFLGYVDQADVWGLKQMCDAFISLDIADYDITAFEALALGAKVVWTDEIDMDANLKQCKNIYVVAPEINAVAQGMELAAASSPISERDRMRQYSWSNYFNSILGLRVTPDAD
jgi:glycosyltransferase involved in cell wall biosynthesis